MVNYDPKSVQLFIGDNPTPLEVEDLTYELGPAMRYGDTLKQTVHVLRPAIVHSINLEMTITGEGARALYALVGPYPLAPRGSASVLTLIRRSLFNSRKGRSAFRRLVAMGVVVRNVP